MYTFHIKEVSQMNRIKSLRIEQGWTQTDLANRISAVKSTISRYESEAAKLDPETISRLCDIFSVSADYLLGLSDLRRPDLTLDDAALLRAFHAAPESVQSGIKSILEPYGEERKNAAAG